VPQPPVVRDTGEALDRGVGYPRQLRFGVTELLGPRAAGREDELLVLVGRAVGVGPADLLAKQVDVDGDA
jgi:hypothetical protein